jgi:hypothetical protein
MSGDLEWAQVFLFLGTKKQHAQLERVFLYKEGSLKIN